MYSRKNWYSLLQNAVGDHYTENTLPTKNGQSDFDEESSGYQSAPWTNSSDEHPNGSDLDTPTPPVACTCENCSLYSLCTRGCLNPGGDSPPLPIWNGTETTFTTNSWQYNYENKLMRDTNHIIFAFASLVNHTQRSFSDRVSLNEIVLWIKQLEAYKPLKNSLSLSERMGEVYKVKDMVKLFEILSDYWSWYNHHLLEHLILEFGGPEDKRRLRQYCDQFTSFLEKRLPNSQDTFRLGTGRGKGQKPLLIKVDENWDTVSLKHIRELHYNIAEILNLRPHVLYLASVSKGCICLHFMVPESMDKQSFSFCESQKKALQEAGVFRVECGEYVWQVCATYQLYLTSEPPLLSSLCAASAAKELSLNSHRVSSHGANSPCIISVVD